MRIDKVKQKMVDDISRIVAREVVGYEFDSLYKNKTDYVHDHGARHDINTPYQIDCIGAAQEVVKYFDKAILLECRAMIETIDEHCHESGNAQELAGAAHIMLDWADCIMDEIEEMTKEGVSDA